LCQLIYQLNSNALIFEEKFFSGEVIPPEKVKPSMFKPSKYIYKTVDQTALWERMNKPLTTEQVRYIVSKL